MLRNKGFHVVVFKIQPYKLRKSKPLPAAKKLTDLREIKGICGRGCDVAHPVEVFALHYEGLGSIARTHIKQCWAWWCALKTPELRVGRETQILGLPGR